jgi:hypothetical protein
LDSQASFEVMSFVKNIAVKHNVSTSSSLWHVFLFIPGLSHTFY